MVLLQHQHQHQHQRLPSHSHTHAHAHAHSHPRPRPRPRPGPRSLSPAQVIQRAARIERLRLARVPEEPGGGDSGGDLGGDLRGGGGGGGGEQGQGPKTPVRRSSGGVAEVEGGRADTGNKTVVRAVMIDAGGGRVVLQGEGWRVVAGAEGTGRGDIF